jgi:hypothetical protein
MTEILQEYVDSRSQQLRVDRAAGVIRGVKLLGLTSRNGRRYRESALTDAVSLYEGAKVNINHPKGHPLSPRDYQDRLGVVRGVHFRAGEGLFGDLHFNPKHALSEQLVWDAEHAPQNVGMSHNVLARTSLDGSETVVEAITKVQGIDLVADPATTSGLYEQAETRAVVERSSSGAEVALPPSAPTPLLHYSPTLLSTMTLDELRTQRPDLVRELERDHEVQLEQVRGELAAMVAHDMSVRRRELILELLQEHGLPLPSSDRGLDSHLVGPEFIETLMRADDEQAVRRLIKARTDLVRSAWRWSSERRPLDRRPRSREQDTFEPATRCGSTQEFLTAVRGR